MSLCLVRIELLNVKPGHVYPALHAAMAAKGFHPTHTTVGVEFKLPPGTYLGDASSPAAARDIAAAVAQALNHRSEIIAVQCDGKVEVHGLGQSSP
jgi:hypothetical protein